MKHCKLGYIKPDGYSWYELDGDSCVGREICDCYEKIS